MGRAKRPVTIELGRMERLRAMSDLGKDPGHGNSVAAWTTVTIIMVASATGTLALWLDSWLGVWASAFLALAGLVVGHFLRKAGYGVGGHRAKNSGH